MPKKNKKNTNDTVSYSSYNTSLVYQMSHNLNFTVGTVIVLILLVLALFPGLLTRYEPNAIDSKSLLLAPSFTHWFGTDNFGRDVYTRVIYGTRVDLLIGISGTIVTFIIGTALGLISGYFGGKTDMIIMRLLDIIMSFPYMVLCIMIVAIMGAGLKSLLIAMWAINWKNSARVVRSEVLVVRSSDYVQAAKSMGLSDAHIIVRHVMPNVITTAIVQAATGVVTCMMNSASLSFLGLGIQPPVAEWGGIIAGGKAKIATAYWIILFPGLFLLFSGLGFSFLGDGIADLFRTKGR